jgi:hypothetical protein
VISIVTSKRRRRGGVTVDSKSGTVIDFCAAVVWRRQQRDMASMYVYICIYIRIPPSSYFSEVGYYKLDYPIL